MVKLHEINMRRVSQILVNARQYALHIHAIEAVEYVDVQNLEHAALAVVVVFEHPLEIELVHLHDSGERSEEVPSVHFDSWQSLFFESGEAVLLPELTSPIIRRIRIRKRRLFFLQNIRRFQFLKN